MLIEVAKRAAEGAIRSNLPMLSRIAAERKRFENWLQLEMLKTLMLEYPEIEIERTFPGTQERCDFWLPESRGVESWVELKLCVTNYCAGFCCYAAGRPITNQISDIERDLTKLQRLPSAHDRAVLLVAYPLPDSPEAHPQWASHLAKLRAAASQVSEVFNVQLEQNGNSAKLVAYVLTLAHT